MAHLARRVAVVAAGEMGAAVAARLVKGGCSVLTNLDGRSEQTRERAKKAGMRDVPFSELVKSSDWFLSILPPRDAVRLAERYIEASKSVGIRSEADGRKVYVDCNAVGPETVKRIAELFGDTAVTFLDAGIIGGPPNDTYTSHIYASAGAEDAASQSALEEFIQFSECGVKITPLKGEGAGIGSASALKMSYAGITKGTSALFCTMILAAHASSPSTSAHLLAELASSQHALLQRISTAVPSAVPKAYRWVAEMEEIGSFVNPQDGTEGDIHRGMARLYKRMEDALQKDGRQEGDIGVLLKFAEDAREKLKGA